MRKSRAACSSSFLSSTRYFFLLLSFAKIFPLHVASPIATLSPRPIPLLLPVLALREAARHPRFTPRRSSHWLLRSTHGARSYPLPHRDFKALIKTPFTPQGGTGEVAGGRGVKWKADPRGSRRGRRRKRHKEPGRVPGGRF